MNRGEEYRALLAELEQTPPALDGTGGRALERERARRRKNRLWSLPAGSFAACFVLFVLLVNLWPPFARACSDIPVLGRLAEAVRLSPSLSAAVENEYVQPIGQSQTVNGITATVEYVIVDLKQVNIFYTLSGEGYETLSGEMPELAGDLPCSISTSDFGQPPGTLLDFTLDFFDNDVPEQITFTFGVTTWDRRSGQTEPDRAYEDEMLSPREEPEAEVLAEFTFTVDFDPTFTQQGETVAIDRQFQMDGQTLTLTEVEIYPTHVRVNFEDVPENTAWMKGLDFYLENEDGERLEPVSNGISGTGSPDSPMIASYRLESPYFSDSQHLTLYLTGAVWLDKDMEWVRVDLAHRTAERLPEGVTFTGADHRAGGWILTFEAERRKENAAYQLFSMTFRDAEGKEYEMRSSGSAVGDGETFEVMLPLPDYHAGEVWLNPSFSRVTAQTPPMVIPVK
ncbi:DUF4179 domain-containing protein [Dysosmobacter sp.]|uniref:DUF4179 domain-containing protein n=1 Tax=Dysosmobacter sp. TaxID=2591382 RepID=UPI002A8DE704|nr:DUF4179 domain-containing protein [Dysosmobacter sp.]MDY3281939.1 DUF4179 domain-containing protein [Dysosmobacter sp.]